MSNQSFVGSFEGNLKLEEFEKEGYWFLPGNEDNKVHGKIIYSGENTSTLLVSEQIMVLEPEVQLLHGQRIDVIHGLLFQQQESEVTLFGCYQEPSNTFPTKIFVDLIIVGHHFESINNVQLTGITARYTLLEEWVDNPGFRLSWDTNNSNSYLTKVEVEQILGEPIFLGSLLGCSVQLYNQIPIPVAYLNILAFTKSLPSNIHLSDQKRIAINTEKELSLKELINVIMMFHEFLTFCMGEVIHIYDIESAIIVAKKESVITDEMKFSIYSNLLSPSETIESEAGISLSRLNNNIKAFEEKTIEKLIRLQIYKSRVNSIAKHKKPSNRNRLLMFKDIESNSAIILANWERNIDELETIIELYLRLTYIPERHVDDLFLTIAQSVEAFHRIGHSVSRIDNDVYDVALQAIKAAIPTEPSDYRLTDNDSSRETIQILRDLLESKLNYLNEFSLKERLLELLDEYKDCFPDRYFTSHEEKVKFSQEVRDTRGSLTHPSSSGNRSRHVIDRDGRHDLIHKLLMILRIGLLKKLELSNEKVKDIISRHH